MRYKALNPLYLGVVLWAVGWLGWTAAASAAPFAYISNFGSDTVSVLDTATNTVISTVPVGDGPLGVAVHPAGTRVYVTNLGGNTISVLDTATNTVIATVPVGAEPVGVAVHPAGTRVYVASNNNTISVIDTDTNTVVITIPVTSGPFGIAVHPTGTRVYVARVGNDTVSVIDTATDTVIATVSVGDAPTGIAVHPAGTRIYVANELSDTVSVLDTATNAVVATVPVGDGPRGVAVHPAGTRAYVANLSSSNVSVIDTTTNTVVATVAAGNQPIGVAVHPAGTQVYVANNLSNTVSVIDTSSNTVIATVPVGDEPVAFGQFIGPYGLCTPATFVSRYPLGLGQEEPVITGRWGGDAISVKKSFKGHLGVDYGAGSGTPVVAAACGRVCKIDDVGKTDWGKYVLIHHILPDGTFRHSLYAHLSTVATSEGRDVSAGEGVGLSGATGKVSGPHLHFGILDDKFCEAGKGYSGTSFPESLESQDAGGRTYYNPSLFVEDWK